MYFVVDASVTGGCAAGSGSSEAQCCCIEGSWLACSSVGSGAPSTADYLVKTADGGLPAERVVTDTSWLTWDWSTAGQAKATVIGLTCTNCIGGTEIDESTLVSVPGARLQSWNNPPASAHSYDDEFDSGTLAAKWTRASSGTTNTVTTGTIDYTASLTTPITDATSVPSVLMFQSDNSTNGEVKITQNYTPSTNETHFFKILSNAQNVSTNGEGSFYFRLVNTTDANEVFQFGTANTGSAHNNYCWVNNNGTGNGTSSGSLTEGARGAASYLVVWKKSNDYYCGMAGEDKKLFTVLAVKTKTGVTTFDRIEFFFSTANETPSIVEGLDFYRYKASLDYSLVNP